MTAIPCACRFSAGKAEPVASKTMLRFPFLIFSSECVDDAGNPLSLNIDAVTRKLFLVTILR